MSIRRSSSRSRKGFVTALMPLTAVKHSVTVCQGHQPLRLHRPSARVAEKTAGYRADDGGRVGPSPSAAGDFTQGGGR
jgi:hypothetical protein